MENTTLNVITGLPRSGSTLLCNILNQNPNFRATSTSILPQLIAGSINTWSNSLEFKSELALDKAIAEDRLRNSLRAFCNTWHSLNEETIVFDKSRGWSHNLMALREIYPNAKVIVTVRDLRNVFASVEKQHRKNPLLDFANNTTMKTIWARADAMFSPNGMVGGCLDGIQDILRRKLSVYWLKYERFVDQPALVMSELYSYLEIEPFEHDFVNIENTSTDPDPYYNYKYPHKGEGPVKPTNIDEWKEYMNDELAAVIMQRFNLYNQRFGYLVPPTTPQQMMPQQMSQQMMPQPMMAQQMMPQQMMPQQMMPQQMMPQQMPHQVPQSMMPQIPQHPEQ